MHVFTVKFLKTFPLAPNFQTPICFLFRFFNSISPFLQFSKIHNFVIKRMQKFSNINSKKKKKRHTEP